MVNSYRDYPPLKKWIEILLVIERDILFPIGVGLALGSFAGMQSGYHLRIEQVLFVAATLIVVIGLSRPLHHLMIWKFRNKKF